MEDVDTLPPIIAHECCCSSAIGTSTPTSTPKLWARSTKVRMRCFRRAPSTKPAGQLEEPRATHSSPFCLLAMSHSKNRCASGSIDAHGVEGGDEEVVEEVTVEEAELEEAELEEAELEEAELEEGEAGVAADAAGVLVTGVAAAAAALVAAGEGGDGVWSKPLKRSANSNGCIVW